MQNMDTAYANTDFDALVSIGGLRESKSYNIALSDMVFIRPSAASKIKVRGRAVAANVPYIPGLAAWYDHHPTNIKDAEGIYVPGRRDPAAPSCARVIADDLGITGYKALLEAADKIDSTDFTLEELSEPKGYMLISYTINGDPRNEVEMDYNRHLVDMLFNHDVETILKDPQVAARVDKYLSNSFLEQETALISEKLRIEKNVMVLDLRGVDISTGTIQQKKHLLHRMTPDCNVSVITYNPSGNSAETKFLVGRSIVNRTCTTYIGPLLESLAKEHGAGGHPEAGGALVPSNMHDKIHAGIMEGLVEL